MTTTELNTMDLSFCVQRLPKRLKTLMMNPEWAGKIFIGGGFIRSVISNEKVNDIDVFVTSEEQARLLALELVDHKRFIHKTDNALTLTDQKPSIQVIYKWVFQSATEVIKSFDFSVCSASIWFTGNKWLSVCDGTYYQDLAAKRLIYRHPTRIEEAGGSTLRVLKYYQKGFRIPVPQLAGVLARLFHAVDMEQINKNFQVNEREGQIHKILTGLLRAVDPNVDPLHEAHLPGDEEIVQMLNPKTDEQ